MCGGSKYQHIYRDDKNVMKSLFPEVDWEEQFICESCTKRELGKSGWKKLKKENE